MRPNWQHIERFRLQPDGYTSKPGERYGVFAIPHAPTGVTLRVMATDGDAVAAGLPPEFAWEHVSVSLPRRCPNWPEMSFIKDLFWGEDECAMQLHVPKSDHKNLHEFCLHIWRPVRAEIPRPPAETVA